MTAPHQPRRAPALVLFLALAAASQAFAAGDDVTTPPPPPRCPDGQVLDPKSRRCVPAMSGAIDDVDRYQAVRQLAYAGRFEGAARVLEAMTDQQDDRVLTYRGFLARKTGRWEEAARHYRQALERNPDNLLARSYMGQGLVEAGDATAARRQHEEILARGGRGSWAEVSLREALASGRTQGY